MNGRERLYFKKLSHLSISMPPGNTSCRFLKDSTARGGQGCLLISIPGDYTFHLRADDAAAVAIDNQKVMDTYSVQTFQPVSQKIVLTKGAHRMAVKYIQRAGKSGLRIAWVTPDGKQEEVPASVLFPKEPSSLRLEIEQIVRICLPVSLIALIAWSFAIAAYFRKALFRRLSYLRKLVEQLSEYLAARRLHRRRFWWAVIVGTLLSITFLCLKERFMPAQGFVVSYYDNPKWEGEPLFSELSPSLSLQVVDRHAFPQRYYSLQWQGWLYVKQEGEYTLFAKANDGIRVWLNDVMLIHYTTSSERKETWWPLHLPKGFYPITIQYYQTKYEYSCVIDWRLPNGNREPLPMQSCFPEKPPDRSFLWKRGVLTGFTLIAWGVLAGVGLVLSLQQRLLRDAFVRKFCKGSRCERLRKLSHWFNNPTNRRAAVVHVLLLLLVGGVIGFHRVGERSLGERIAGTWSWDEVVHTSVAQRIVTTGDWFHLEYQGNPYYNKPPLKLWLNALTFAVVGDDEFWVRTWSVVFGLAAIVTLYYFGKTLTGSPLIGLFGACILLSSPYYIFLHNIRDGVQDSAVNLFCLLALYAFWRRADSPYCYYFAGLFMGLGALSKSVNGLLPIGVIVLYLAASRSFTEFKNARLYGMLVIALLLPGLWFGAHTVLSPGFFERAICQEIFARASASAVDKNVGIGHHIVGPWYYLGSLLEGLHPWGYFYPLALLWGIWRSFSKQNTDLFLVIWVLFILIGFSVPGYKSHWYIYGLYPPLTLLIARFAFALIKWSRKNPCNASTLCRHDSCRADMFAYLFPFCECCENFLQPQNSDSSVG